MTISNLFDILEADQEKEPSGQFIPTQLKGDFELKNVDFFYPNGTQALKNVSLSIQPNKITALVGLSGAGKSTLINLLDKFYEPSSGEDADTIIVMDNGRVVEQGLHEELYDKQGTYFRIFNAMANSLNSEKIAKTLN